MTENEAIAEIMTIEHSVLFTYVLIRIALNR
jgi:hypothetical protein